MTADIVSLNVRGCSVQIENASPLKSNRRGRRKQEMRARILEASAQLIAEQGYEKTTIEQICERADVALMTFYNHFSSKQQLTNVLSESMLSDALRNRIEQARLHSENTIERLRFFILSTADQVRNYGELERRLIRHLMREASLENNEVVEVLPRSYAHAALGKLIEEGQLRGDITRDFDAGLLGEMLAGTIDTIFIGWLYDDSYPIDTRLEELVVFCERFFVARTAKP
jgi:AcrR family transcriptional regulator